VLTAPPGSGKTTLVPLLLLQEAWMAGQKIIMLEPRRLAARAAAARMAELLGEQVGETLGYRVRLDSRVTSRTRIEVVTEGILTRRLQRDPELEGVGLVIFDEFHERSLQADLGLSLTLDVMAGLREDLRLLVMSATLDGSRLVEFLNGAPLLQARGRSHPVAIHYLGDPPPGRRLSDVVTAAVWRLLESEPGDLLVFLPGVGEIRQTAEQLTARLRDVSGAPLICPLFGDLGKSEQDRSILPDPQGRRRVVLATAIAETSLTIEGVNTVLDSGWSRLPRFLPNTGLTRLETLRVSRAAAEQRAGRAGRLGPGSCYRLWSEARQASLAEQQPPEILEADLAPLMLDLLHWGVNDPRDLRWLDPPPPAACAQAMDLLRSLGAVDAQGRLSTVGRVMGELPLHPRLAHMLLRAADSPARAKACDLAALLSERDILRVGPDGGRGSDIDLRLSLLARWREGSRAEPLERSLDIAGIRRLERASRQFHGLLRALPWPETGGVRSTAGLLAMAYPDRIARQTRHGRFQLASGRGASLPEEDNLAAAPYLVAAELDAGRTEARIRLALAIAEAELRELPDLPLQQRETVVWDTGQQAVLAVREERLGALRLSARPLPEAEPQAVLTAMLGGLRQMGLACLPWDSQTRQWINRLLCLREWQPEAGWPDLSDDWLSAHLEAWLGPWLNGVTRCAQLQKLDLLGILRSRLGWERCKRLDELAPTHLTVPSGSRKRLEYTPGAPPVLAVRLQELFGLAQTPTVCAGQVAVRLHLLSPAQRPIQVTQDLAGFWQRTYSEVKKELKGRYPKHYWPDDPYQAQPTARARPRGKSN
jgi:ATP-dependent helicase HrpB